MLGGGGGISGSLRYNINRKKNNKFSVFNCNRISKTSNRRIRIDFDSQAEELLSDKLKINGN